MSALVDVPTDDIVAVAWAASILGDRVGTTMPEPTTWLDGAFVQAMAIGGTPAIDYPLSQPACTFDCWAYNVSSNRPPWGKANALAAQLIAATYAATEIMVALPRALGSVRLLSAYPLSHARRVTGDDASYAHYSVDLQLVWARS